MIKITNKHNVITTKVKQFINGLFSWSIKNRYIYKLNCTMKKETFINQFINVFIIKIDKFINRRVSIL